MEVKDSLIGGNELKLNMRLVLRPPPPSSARGACLMCPHKRHGLRKCREARQNNVDELGNGKSMEAVLAVLLFGSLHGPEEL